MPKDVKTRKRMVVEEVSAPESTVEDKVTPETVSSAPTEEKNELLGVVKEKVEELQDITEDIGESADKSSEVQEELVQAVEKVEPAVQQEEEVMIPTKGRFNVFVILIPGILLLGALLGGIYFYQTAVNTETKTPAESPTPTTASETPIPSYSPSATLILSKYPINVENGSGIPGTASSAKDLLTKAGFKVSAAGNAPTYDYTDTIIETKADVPQAFIDKLTTTLSGVYKVGTPKVLASSSTDEVVVIIGSSKSQ